MTKQKPFFVLISLLMPLMAVGQIDDKPQHEVGINITNLLVNVLGNDGNVNDVDFNDIVYRRIKGNKALRIGFGVRLLVNQLDETNSPGTTQLKDINMTLSIGKEFRKNVGKKWLYYGGIMAYLNGGSSQSETLIQDSSSGMLSRISASSWNLGIGAGPIVGFQFNINDHLSLGSQGAFIMFFSNRYHSLNSYVVPEEKSSTFTFTANTLLPSLLFLNLQF